MLARLGRGVSVIRSTSHNVYYNLALEEYLREKLIWQEGDELARVLLLYVNKPAVVIGRAQNPFVECNFTSMRRDNVVLARRASGGGAVYHDGGNLNCSFLTPKQSFSRTRFVEAVARGLRNEMSIDASVSDRHNIMIGDHKISGSAYRLTRLTAYHHFTLLVNSDLTQLQRHITPDPVFLARVGLNRGTVSVRDRVTQLADVVDADDECGSLMGRTEQVVAQMAHQTYHEEGGSELSPQEIIDIAPESLPEVALFHRNLTHSQWIYDETPAFQVSTSSDKPPLAVLRGKVYNSEGVPVRFGSLDFFARHPHLDNVVPRILE